MNTTTITALSALALLGTAAPLQQSLTPTTTPLTGQATPGDFDASHWAEALEQGDLKQRMHAYESVLEQASSDRQAYEQLRTWAADTGAPGLAWTAQLMLRELDADPFAGLRRGLPFGRQPGAPRDPFDMSQLDGLLEQLRAVDPFGSGGAHSFWGPGGGLRLDLDAFGQGLPLGPNMHFDSSSFRLETGPDGVKVEVQEMVGDELQTKTYEAESLEALLEAHPELAERIGRGQGFQWSGAGRGRPYQPFTQGQRLPGALDDSSGGAQGLRPLRPSLDKLGIRMVAPEARQAEYEGIPGDVGLQVIEVVPGSLADVIGVEPDELVTSIAGRTIRSAADVRAALRSVSLEDRIEVLCVRPDGETQVRVWEPKSPEEERSF